MTTDLDAWLAEQRAGLERVTPAEAAREAADGAILVDVRPAWQRETDGEIPGSVVVESNHVAWRLHPGSDARLDLARPGQRWIVLCTEGYASSLVVRWLDSLGLDVADLDGGYRAWAAAGLPTTAGTTPAEHRVGTPGRLRRAVDV